MLARDFAQALIRKPRTELPEEIEMWVMFRTAVSPRAALDEAQQTFLADWMEEAAHAARWLKTLGLEHASGHGRVASMASWASACSC